MTEANFPSLFRTISRKIYSPKRNISLSTVVPEEKVFRGETKPCNFDFVVVGGGVLGLATARELLASKPHLKLALLEKECDLASHQSTRNPGLVHSGVYCPPGSAIAKLCVKGAELLYAWCKQANVPVRRTGKLIVATDCVESRRLDALMAHAEELNVADARVLTGPCEIQRVEPYCEGVRALHLPHAGAVCWAAVARSLADDVRCRGGRIHTGFRVEGFARNLVGSECERRKFPVHVFGHERGLNASAVAVCAGLFADRLAAQCGGAVEPMLFPMRADYLRLKSNARHLVRGNIFPVPDPCLPFLGPHFARWAADGTVCAGPNVTPTSHREGYRIHHVSLRDVWEMATYRGFWALQPSQLSTGMKGVLSHFLLKRQLRRLQAYVPRLQGHQLLRGPSIVYPQAVSSRGYVCEDLVLEISDEDVPCREVCSRVLHCRVAPPAAATASLAIAKVIAGRMQGLTPKL